MRYALLIALMATSAQAARLKVVWPVGDGHDSYRIETKESNGVKPAGALYLGPSVPRAYQDQEQEQVDPETGETNTVAVPVPVPHSLCKWITGDHAPTARTEQEMATIEAEAAQAEADRIAALAQEHGAKIGMLVNLLSVYGLQIPTSKAEVVAKIESLVAAATITAEQSTMIGTIDAVYKIIEDAGIKDDVAAIWEAMQK